MSSTFTIDGDDLDSWVIIPDVSAQHRDLLPAGGPVVGWLYLDRPSGALSLWVETAVFLAPTGELTRIGLPLGKYNGVGLILRGAAIGFTPTKLPDSAREHLGLPDGPPWGASEVPVSAFDTPASEVDDAPESSDDPDPDDPDALLDHGVRLADAGDPIAAESYFRAAANVSGGEPFFVANLASYLANMGRPGEAIELYDLARTTLIERVDGDAEEDDPELWLLGSVECHMAVCLTAFERDDEARAMAAPWRDHPDHGPDVARLFLPT